MYESVNDFGLRQRLIKNMGFCALHSQEILTFPGAKLGAAVIEQAMLKEALRQMSRASASRGSIFSRGHKRIHTSLISQRNDCPACLHEQDAEQRAIEELVAHWDDAWADLLENAGGMCFNHLMIALRLAPKSVSSTLKAIHERLWEILIAQLGEFIRKQDYRFRDEEISMEEGASSYRAVAVLTGESKIVIPIKPANGYHVEI
jgi:hypothetical protein